MLDENVNFSWRGCTKDESGLAIFTYYNHQMTLALPSLAYAMEIDKMMRSLESAVMKSTVSKCKAEISGTLHEIYEKIR